MSKRGRKSKIQYNEMPEKFSTIEKAEAYIKSMNEWTLSGKHEQVEGLKVAYKCKVLKHQCPAKIYYFMDEDTHEIKMYRTPDPHSHAPKPKRGVPPELRAGISDMVSQGVLLP